MSYQNIDVYMPFAKKYHKKIVNLLGRHIVQMQKTAAKIDEIDVTLIKGGDYRSCKHLETIMFADSFIETYEALMSIDGISEHMRQGFGSRMTLFDAHPTAYNTVEP